MRTTPCRHNPLNNDTSASYNKPASVMHFSQEADFTEDFVLFIDADMLLVKPIDVSEIGARKGIVVSEEVQYMIGTNNGLADAFLPPEAARRATPVGWYHIFHRDDLKVIAPRWLHYCGRVRTEPHRYWKLDGVGIDIPTGDAYVKRGQAPWIAEMYGYSFAAAEVGVEHRVTHGIVAYPSELPWSGQDPFILHYGIDFNIGPDYNWNKMVFKQLDVLSCRRRFFGPPPKPRNRRESAGAHVVNILNRAFCDFYSQNCDGQNRMVCPPSERPPPGHNECDDNAGNCWAWAIDNQCEENPKFMSTTCRRSCNLCADQRSADDATSSPRNIGTSDGIALEVHGGPDEAIVEADNLTSPALRDIESAVADLESLRGLQRGAERLSASLPVEEMETVSLPPPPPPDSLADVAVGADSLAPGTDGPLAGIKERDAMMGIDSEETQQKAITNMNGRGSTRALPLEPLDKRQGVLSFGAFGAKDDRSSTWTARVSDLFDPIWTHAPSSQGRLDPRLLPRRTTSRNVRSIAPDVAPFMTGRRTFVRAEGVLPHSELLGTEGGVRALYVVSLLPWLFVGVLCCGSVACRERLRRIRRRKRLMHLLDSRVASKL